MRLSEIRVMSQLLVGMWDVIGRGPDYPEVNRRIGLQYCLRDYC